MTAGHESQPVICRARKRTRAWGPDGVVEIVIGAHHELVVFWSLITRHVVASVVIKMDALQIADIAVAIWQQHVNRSVVNHEAIEINRREWEHRLDAIRR